MPKSKVDRFMAFTRAQHKAHRAAMLNTLQHFDPHTGVLTMGADGTMGPKGMKGEPGVAGIPTEKYILCYAGLHFEIWLKPGTFSMIEDATQVNGDELEFIKMVDEGEWTKIREAWCSEWHKRRGHKAFEMGLYEEFEAGVCV